MILARDLRFGIWNQVVSKVIVARPINAVSAII